MSFPSQRFFSLSSSRREAILDPTSSATEVPTSATAAGTKFLDQTSLQLLVHAAASGNNSSGGAITPSINNIGYMNQNNSNNVANNMSQQHQINNPIDTTNNGGMNDNSIHGSNSETPIATSGAVVDGNAANNFVNNNLQQAFLQSMQTQQQQQQQHQQQQANQNGRLNLNAAAAGNPNQFGQLFGNMAAQAPQQVTANQNVNVGAPIGANNPNLANGQVQLNQATNAGATPHSLTPQVGGMAASASPQNQAQAFQGQQQQQQANQQQQQQGTTQGNMIAQLVASLQAQQQAQQQAQVQAALVRAFGPGANTMPTANLTGNPTNLAVAPIGAQGQGMAGVGPMQGLNNVMNGAAQQAGTQGIQQGLQQNTAARDLLSRMQLAQSVQQQQQQVQQAQQQQQQVQQAQQQAQAAQQQAQQQVQANNSYDPTKAATATTISASNATADDLITLQLEQERHNRMLQMVQADRQERAMLANQEALMKKHRRDGNGGQVGGVDVSMNDAVNTMFNQFPNANALAAAGAAGFPNAASSLLTNGLNTAQLTNGLNAAQLTNGLNAAQFKGLPGLNQGLNNVAAVGALQNGLINAATAGGLPNLANFGAVGQEANAAAEQHLHQKLGSARGAAIVPCRARGMPVDHNFKTAYFVIPDGIEHGDELMCSYPACRQAGVKFRYCLHCKVPVAKRNFRNRHRHGVPGGDGASGSDVEEESEEETSEADCEHGVAGATNPLSGGICQPAANGNGGEEDDSGVKKEHILIIPGADMANNCDMPLMKKKKKKNVRVPCRARGMPMAHNFKSAYFFIPPTIEHGDELLCSFPSCRSAGAKFRYCLHCKVPVAKRNFRNRHKHGNMGGLDKKKASLKTPESLHGASEDKVKAENNNAHPESSDKATEGEKPAASNVNEDAKPSESQPAAASTMESNQMETTVPSASMDEGDAGAKVTVSTSHNATQVQQWVQLLENKPNPGDKQSMAVWMLNLMNATEAGGGAATAAVVQAATAAPPVAAAASATVEAPVKEEETEKPAVAVASQEVATEGPSTALAQVSEVAQSTSPVEEEGSATGSSESKRESEEDDDADSQRSGSQPPKKKFKQEFEEV